jgi:hypothetical protein
MLKLFLDTNDTDTIKNGSNSTPSDCSFIFGQTLPDSITNVGVCLYEATIPNIRYNVRSGVNNILYFYENAGAVTFTATLTQGVYDATSLASALQTAMNGSGAANTYTVTYSSTTKKMTIATVLPFTFQVLSSSTCLTLIGFEAMTSFATTKTGDYMVNLLTTRYVDIVVNFNAASIALNKRSNILARVNLDDAIGTVIFYQASVLANTVTQAESLRQIEVRLYDDAGDPYVIDKNHSCTYTLLLSPLD